MRFRVSEAEGSRKLCTGPEELFFQPRLTPTDLQLRGWQCGTGNKRKTLNNNHYEAAAEGHCASRCHAGRLEVKVQKNFNSICPSDAVKHDGRKVAFR